MQRWQDYPSYLSTKLKLSRLLMVKKKLTLSKVLQMERRGGNRFVLFFSDPIIFFFLHPFRISNSHRHSSLVATLPSVHFFPPDFQGNVMIYFPQSVVHILRKLFSSFFRLFGTCVTDVMVVRYCFRRY